MKLSYEMYSTIKKLHKNQKSLVEIASDLACSKDTVQEVILSQDFAEFTASTRQIRNSRNPLNALIHFIHFRA